MKKILMAEYLEYNSDFKIGNHHYGKMFSENDYQVLWLSPVYNHLTKISNNKLFCQRKDLNKKIFERLDENIYGFSPYSLMLYGNLPLLDTKLANKMSIEFTIPNIMARLKENNFEEVDVLWLTNPKYYYLTKLVKYKKLIYRCADDISEFNGMCKTMPYFEELIINDSDCVFVTAHNLLEKKKHLRDDLIYLPNGVELDNFIRNKYYEPKEFENNDKKKCIYVGAIDHWFDLQLVQKCVEKFEDLEFYFIGPVKIDLSALKAYKNVYILGRKDYKEISNYLYYSDVSIIPFEVSNLTNSITPIKLYEYMSVGLNVVSTNFKEMNYLNSPAYVSKDYNEFCDYIQEAIKNKDKNRERNIQFAKANTWKKRFDEIKKYL